MHNQRFSNPWFNYEINIYKFLRYYKKIKLGIVIIAKKKWKKCKKMQNNRNRSRSQTADMSKPEEPYKVGTLPVL